MSIARSGNIYRNSLVVVLITLAASLTALFFYCSGPLGGNFNQFFLPAVKFGVPSELRTRGITEIFTDQNNSGWDGQFYYYISNDIFARKDTVQHIDASAYRYQRIGLPLLAKIASMITMQSWVSPQTYYLTSLFLILLGTGVAAWFFQGYGSNPYYALIWSLGMGTQATQLTGLPDASADALLILSLVSLIKSRRVLYAIAITFTILTREVYLLIPLCVICSEVYQYYGRKNLLSLFKYTCVHVIPILIWFVWQGFIRLKFHVSPSSQAAGILDYPLYQTFYYMFAGLNGSHPVVGVGSAAYIEGVAVLLYFLLLVISVLAIFPVMLSKSNVSQVAVKKGIALGFLLMILLYCCFGSTVMMHHTGYFKAANILLFVIPFMACLNHQQVRTYQLIIMLMITALFSYLLKMRTIGPAYSNTPPQIVYAVSEPACLKSYQAKITPTSIEVTTNRGLIGRMLGKTRTILNVKVTNNSHETFSPYMGKGNVNVSYHWLDINSASVIKDGERTSLSRPLKPGQSTVVPLVLKMPVKKGDYLLKLSLVQEGCSWFYQANASSAYNIPYAIR